MKKYSGLILLLLSFQVFAGSKSAVLMLRAHVPETFQVNFIQNEKGPIVHITSNRSKRTALPKSSVQQVNDVYLVSITHP